jgi:hypothetical protein
MLVESLRKRFDHGTDHLFTAVFYRRCPKLKFEWDGKKIEVHPSSSDDKRVVRLPTGDVIEATPLTLFHIHDGKTRKFLGKFSEANLPPDSGFEEVSQS